METSLAIGEVMKKQLMLIWTKFKLLLWVGWYVMVVFAVPTMLADPETVKVKLLHQPWWIALTCSVSLLFAYGVYRATKQRNLNFNVRGLFNRQTLFIILTAYAVTSLCDEVGVLFLEWMGETTTDNQALLEAAARQTPMVLNFVMIAFYGPFLEEFIFRGLLDKQLFPHWQRLGFICSSLLFGLAHGPTNLPSLFIYSSSGFILTYLYRRTNNLAVPTAVHVLNNLVVTIFFYI